MKGHPNTPRPKDSRYDSWVQHTSGNLQSIVEELFLTEIIAFVQEQSEPTLNSILPPVQIYVEHSCFQLDDGETFDGHTDSRQWTQEHYEAASIHPSPAVLALTPPQGDDIRDVDVRGPGKTRVSVSVLCYKRQIVTDKKQNTDATQTCQAMVESLDIFSVEFIV